MLDIITAIGLVLGIVIIIMGYKKQKKLFKYIGCILILVSLIYIFPEFLKGFVQGVIDGTKDLH